MSKQRVVITGGAGFIGSNLARRLVERGKDVLVFDNFFTGRKEFLLPLQNDVNIVTGDLRNKDEVVNVITSFKPQVVFHLAALHYIPYCNEHPLETLAVNTIGTETLLQACASVDIEKFIYTSTAAVYPIQDLAHKENDPAVPTDIYGNTKFFGEHLIRVYHERTGTACSIARLFNTYGYNETNPHVIPAILNQLKEFKNEIELGNIEPKRDYIYVEDVADALAALEQHAVGFDIYNVGTGEEYSVKELVDIISSIIHRALSINQTASRKRKIDRIHLLADISKIKQATQWEPKYNLSKGMEQLIHAKRLKGNLKCLSFEGGKRHEKENRFRFYHLGSGSDCMRD